MFTVNERNRVRDRIVELARADRRILATAFVGSLADSSTGDRWSDLDVGFALVDDISLEGVVEEWTRGLQDEFRAVHLFDLPHLSTLYRVFLLPGNLQVDLSFTPKADFRPLGPKFKLVYGNAIEPKHSPPPSPQYMFGLAVHHLVRARICIERGKLWQAAYWTNEARNQALSLACLDRGLPSSYGRGFDNLPREILQLFERTLIGSLDQDSLLRVLSKTLEEVMRNSQRVGDAVSRLEPQLRELGSATME